MTAKGCEVDSNPTLLNRRWSFGLKSFSMQKGMIHPSGLFIHSHSINRESEPEEAVPGSKTGLPTPTEQPTENLLTVWLEVFCQPILKCFKNIVSIYGPVCMSL